MAAHLTTMNISLPASMRNFIKQEMKQQGFANASEFIRHLIRTDQRRASDELRALIDEGVRSGPGIDMAPARRAAFRDRLIGRHGRRKRSA